MVAQLDKSIMHGGQRGRLCLSCERTSLCREPPEPQHPPGPSATPRRASEQSFVPSARSLMAGGGGGGGGSGVMRVGLHVEQRGSLKKHVRLLKQRLDRASSDLQVIGFTSCSWCYSVGVAHIRTHRVRQTGGREQGWRSAVIHNLHLLLSWFNSTLLGCRHVLLRNMPSSALVHARSPVASTLSFSCCCLVYWEGSPAAQTCHLAHSRWVVFLPSKGLVGEARAAQVWLPL